MPRNAKKPKLIRPKIRARSTIGFQIQLVLFDIKFRLTAAAIEVAIQHFGARAFHVGSHEANVRAVLRHFHFGHDATCTRPTLGLIRERMIEMCRAFGVLKQFARGRKMRLHVLIEYGIAGQTIAIMHVCLGLGPSHDFGIREVRIAAQHKNRLGPLLPQISDQPFDNAAH